MAIYLLKTEPDEFSYDDLVAKKVEPWDGVTNAAAQKHMRAVKKGDRAFIYHTGKERRIAGLAEVVRGAYPDPDKPGLTASGDPKFVLFDCRPVKAAKKQCTLADVKTDERFANFALVKQARLSVMPVPSDLAKALRSMAGL
ncbi:MAG: EVE domain-containing protein [Planctomycetota bacterium]